MSNLWSQYNRKRAVQSFSRGSLFIWLAGILGWQAYQIRASAGSFELVQFQGVSGVLALVFIAAIVFLFSACFVLGRPVLGLGLAFLLGSHPIVFAQVYEGWGFSGALVTLTVVLALLYIPLFFKNTPQFFYPWIVAMITGVLFAIFGRLCFEALALQAASMVVVGLLYKGSLRKRLGLLSVMIVYFGLTNFILNHSSHPWARKIDREIARLHDVHAEEQTHDFKTAASRIRVRAVSTTLESLKSVRVAVNSAVANDGSANWQSTAAVLVKDPSYFWGHVRSLLLNAYDIELRVGNFGPTLPLPWIITYGVLFLVLLHWKRGELMLLMLFGATALAITLATDGASTGSFVHIAVLALAADALYQRVRHWLKASDVPAPNVR